MKLIYESNINTSQQNISQHSQLTIKIQLFNKIESAAKTIAQVMAIENIVIRVPKIKEWSQFLIQQEQQQQNRFIKQLETKYSNNDREAELQKAKQEYQQLYLKLWNMVLQKKKELNLSLENQSDQINIQPAIDLQDLLNKFYLESIIDFHNLLKFDQKGEQLQQSIINYSKKLSQHLYFHLIKEVDPNLKLLFTFILINNTQDNQMMLKILNGYISSFIQEEKQNVTNCLNFIISLFDELSEYLNIIKQSINDRNIQVEDKLKLNEKQFEIILLILDNSNSKSKQNVLCLNLATFEIIKKLQWIYRDDCSQKFINYQQKELTKLLSKEVDCNIISDLNLVLDNLRSAKLKLLIERIIEFHRQQEKEIKLELLKFNFILPQDKETLYNIQFKNSDNLQSQLKLPKQQESDVSINSEIFSFLRILYFAAKSDLENINFDYSKKLSQLITDQIQSYETQDVPNLFVTRQRIKESLVLLLQIQKLNQNTFKELWRLAEQLRLYLERLEEFINQNTLQGQFFPSLNTILSIKNCLSNEPFDYQIEKNQILKDLSTYHSEFNQIINLIEQFRNKDELKFIQNVKQYYKQEFKQPLLLLQDKGSDQVQQAIKCIFLNINI
ncbi:unnamed protein product [Paramecium sonneborni]|uniref:Uncharacterized protein n=1 Tax=Paramecium sonneborni TaxID=65129 RepID=A0A8S1R636_9CILI|nr:unnamed protein product [Paramecium sonneborni]